MFTSLNDLKVNVSVYHQEYVQNFNSLVNQKVKDRTSKIDKIMSEIFDNKIFKLKKDEFEEMPGKTLRKII